MEYLNNKSTRNPEQFDKIPFFLNKSGSPTLWFQLLEAKYDFSALSSTNKFYFTISCLPPDILKTLSDNLVEASSSPSPYNSLKDKIIDHYKVKPSEVIINYFLTNTQGKSKPSEYLTKAIRDLESQCPGVTKDNHQVLRQLFIAGLAPNIQKIVNGISNIELTKLADFADKMFEKEPLQLDEKIKNETINTNDKSYIISLTTEISDLKIQIQTLQEKFNKLEQKVNYFTNKKPRNHQNLSHPKPVSGSSSPTEENAFNNANFNGKIIKQQQNFCFYHNTYGTGAKKCQVGCTYQPKSFDLKISCICIHHARHDGDVSLCMPGCTHYNSINNGHVSR